MLRPLSGAGRNYGQYPIVIVAALAMLLTPIQSYAGTNQPHPHAMLQLIAESLHFTLHHVHVHTGDHRHGTGNEVALRADHHDHRQEGDRAVDRSTRADPAGLTKQSLTTPVYVAALLPQSLVTVDPDLLYRVAGTLSAQPLSGRAISPELPPPRPGVPALTNQLT